MDSDQPNGETSKPTLRAQRLLVCFFGGIGAAFSMLAIWIRVEQRLAWGRGLGRFDTEFFGVLMSIDAAVGWLHTFSVPFWVLAAFALYRIVQQRFAAK